MKRFTVYRRGDLSETHNADRVNAPDMPQYEGCVFTDGTCVLRWLTASRSTSVWGSFDEMWKIHGHDDPNSKHGTVIVWHDIRGAEMTDTIEPTEEQKQAAKSFVHSEFGLAPSIQFLTPRIARLFAEREAALLALVQHAQMSSMARVADLATARARIAELEAEQGQLCEQEAARNDEQGPWVVWDSDTRDGLPWGGRRGWEEELRHVVPYETEEEARRGLRVFDERSQPIRVLTLAEARAIKNED